MFIGCLISKDMRSYESKLLSELNEARASFTFVCIFTKILFCSFNFVQNNSPQRLAFNIELKDHHSQKKKGRKKEFFMHI